MYAHKEEHVEKYKKAVDEVFNRLSCAIKENKVTQLLEGEPAASGFARIN